MAKNKLTFEEWVNTSTYPGTDTPINKKDRRNQEYFANYEKKVEEASDAQAEKIAKAHGQKSKTVTDKEKTTTDDDAHKDIKISKARYDKSPDVKVGGKKVFHGTNIPTTGFSPEQIERYNATLKADIDNKDWSGANDTLFSIAHAQGGGQGNPRVGALQSGMWRVTADPKATLWAEQNLNSANDEYILRDDKGVPTGVVLRFDEKLGIVRGTPKKGQKTNWESIGSWGENARAGIVEGRPTNFPKAGLTTTSIFNPDKPGYDEFTGNLIDGAGRTGTGRVGTGWNVGGPGGPAGETSLLAYRPGSEAYWKSYMGPELTGSLMRMKQPAVAQASLGYLPGEVRSPASKQMWSQFLGMGGLGTKGRSPDKQFQGAIPQGTWRTNIASYPGLGASGIRQPGWQFAAAPSQMIAQPAWTAYDITPQAAGEWTGLLGDWAAPALNTTNLLGAA